MEEGITEAFKDKNYGDSIKAIGVVLTCRSYDSKQRRRFKKDIGRLEHDILPDYFLMKNIEMEGKTKLFTNK